MRLRIGIVLIAAALVTAVCVSAYAQSVTLRSFTDRFAAALQAAVPSMSVTVLGDLQLSVRRSDGVSTTIHLTNAHREYSTDPQSFYGIVRRFALALAERPPVPGKLDPKRIVPLVKDRAWLEQLAATFKKQDASQQPVFEEFNKELVVVYAEDTEKSTRYLSSAEKLGVERDKLLPLAVENLKRLLPPVEVRELEDGLLMITSHADYGASLLLVDHMWFDGQIKVDGDIVVAVPAKDVIFATGSRNRKGLKALRAAAKRVAQGRYAVIDTLFVYRKGRFVKFGRK
jgi:uncharacterized protein YtpQ (UPF0354 family)